MIIKQSYPIQQHRTIRCTILGCTKAPFRLQRMTATSRICGIKISSAMLVVWHTREQPVYRTRYGHSTWSANRSPEHHGRNKAGLSSACVDSGIWPTAGNFVINDLLIWNRCAKIHHVPSSLCSSVLSNSKVLVKKLCCCLSEIIFFIAHIFIIPFSTLCSATSLALLLFCSDLFIITIIIISEQWNVSCSNCYF